MFECLLFNGTLHAASCVEAEVGEGVLKKLGENCGLAEEQEEH